MSQTWIFHGPPDCCMYLQNRTGRPAVDRTIIWHGATGNETRHYGKDRLVVWHELNDTVALQTRKTVNKNSQI